jgi:molecular chaperone GrpE
MIPREPEEEPTNEKEPTAKEEAESLEEALAEAKQKVEEYLTNWQRTQADFVNYKRRNEQERQEFGKFANSQLILSLLPVLDDLERAFESVTPQVTRLKWVEGIRLIDRKLRAALEAHGVSQIEALGEPFDPNLHEATMHSKGEEGIVVQEMQKGYMLHDRVIRPSKVVVGNGETE